MTGASASGAKGRSGSWKGMEATPLQRGRASPRMSPRPNHAEMLARQRISTLETMTKPHFAAKRRQRVQKGERMAKFFANLTLVLIIGFALAALLALFPDFGYRPPTGDLLNGVLQWLHVFFGITWIGLLYYFNFVQIPTMPTVPAELKPGVSKYIAPSPLFYFRWAAAFTVLTGLLLALSYDALVEALTLQPSAQLRGICM